MRHITPYSSPVALSKLDGRTKEARLVRETRAALRQHVGGKPSATQNALIERCVQLTLRVAAMDRKFNESGVQTEHDTRTYLAWSNSLSRALRDLGMQPSTRDVFTLSDHLAQRAAAA